MLIRYKHGRRISQFIELITVRESWPRNRIREDARRELRLRVAKGMNIGEAGIRAR